MPTQLCVLVQYHPYSCNPPLDILISYLLKVTSHYFHTLYPAFSHHYARHTQGLQSISSFPSLTISYWLIQHFHGFVYEVIFSECSVLSPQPAHTSSALLLFFHIQFKDFVHCKPQVEDNFLLSF